MKEMKLEKGITLIALIITVIVLLIIAAVTIGNIKENGIIGHAQNARSEYTIAQEKERIALAYSEYKIKQTFDANIGEFEIDGEDVTSEPVGSYGWKVTYENTGNSYGINTKGEYDEAVSMIIEASEATGVSLDKFIIFEDKYAITQNAKPGTTTMPERYVFYNWAEVTNDERKVLELYDPITPSTALVENASNRILIMDTNGDGKVTYVDIGKMGYEDSDFYQINAIISAGDLGKMTDDINNFYAQICYYQDNGEKVYDTIGANSIAEMQYCFLWDWDEDYSYCNEQSSLIGIAFGRDDSFRAIYTNHPYYASSPKNEADFE